MFVNFLKSRLIFNIFYCFWMFANELFTYLTCAYLKKGALMWNLQYIFSYKEETKIWADFQICIIVPLIRHFVWYLEKERRCDIEALSIDRELNKEHFYGKIKQKMHQKLASDPFLIFLNNPKQPLDVINYFKNKVFWKRIIKKP